MTLNKKLVKSLSDLENSKIVSNGKEIAVRCPFCKDSVKSNTPHMYIGMKENVYLYDCKRCPASGVLDKETLMKLKIKDEKILIWISEYNTQVLAGRYKGKINDKNSISYKLPDFNEEDKNKILYLNKRTNIDIKKQKNIEKYKIILSLKKYLIENKIKRNNIDHDNDYLKMIDNHFVGFLCSDNKSAIFRNVSALNYRKRYLNLKFTKMTSRMIYILNGDLDLMTSNPVISLSEGPFDIINMHNTYFKNKDTSDTIFGAVGTKKGFRQGLIETLKLSAFYGAQVNIFSNEEITLDEYSKAFRIFKDTFKYNIYYNDSGEDFGDIRNGIEPIVYNLKF